MGLGRRRPSCAQEMVALHWEGRVGAEMGVLGAAPWGWALLGSIGASCQQEGSLPATLLWRAMGAELF